MQERPVVYENIKHGYREFDHSGTLTVGLCAIHGNLERLHPDQLQELQFF